MIFPHPSLVSSRSIMLNFTESKTIFSLFIFRSPKQTFDIFKLQKMYFFDGNKSNPSPPFFKALGPFFTREILNRMIGLILLEEKGGRKDFNTLNIGCDCICIKENSSSFDFDPKTEIKLFLRKQRFSKLKLAGASSFCEISFLSSFHVSNPFFGLWPKIHI